MVKCGSAAKTLYSKIAVTSGRLWGKQHTAGSLCVYVHVYLCTLGFHSHVNGHKTPLTKPWVHPWDFKLFANILICKNKIGIVSGKWVPLKILHLWKTSTPFHKLQRMFKDLLALVTTSANEKLENIYFPNVGRLRYHRVYLSPSFYPSALPCDLWPVWPGLRLKHQPTHSLVVSNQQYDLDDLSARLSLCSTSSYSWWGTEKSQADGKNIEVVYKWIIQMKIMLKSSTYPGWYVYVIH